MGLVLLGPTQIKREVGGEGGIRTLAQFYPTNPLAGGPLWPLGYLSKVIKNWKVKNKLSRA